MSCVSHMSKAELGHIEQRARVAFFEYEINPFTDIPKDEAVKQRKIHKQQHLFILSCYSSNASQLITHQ